MRGQVGKREYGWRASKQKDRPKAALSVALMAEDQAPRNAGASFRRQAMKPTLKNPKIIMAQVDGSGTPETGASPAGRSKAATIAPKKSWLTPVVTVKLLFPGVRNDEISKVLISQRLPLPILSPGKVLPSKTEPGPAIVVPLTFSASSANVWPSETIRVRKALPVV